MLPSFEKEILCLFLLLVIFQIRNHGQVNTIQTQYDSIKQHTFEYAEANQLRFYFQDSKGYLWGSGGDFGLIRFDGHAIKSYPFDAEDSTSYSGCPLWGNDAEILEDSQGKIWVSSSRTCLDRFDPVLGRFEKIGNQLKGTPKTWDLFEDSQQNMWIGTNKGVYRYDLNTRQFSFFELPAGVVAFLIFEDHEKNIWVVSNGLNSLVIRQLDQESSLFAEPLVLLTQPPADVGDNRKDGVTRIPNTASFLILAEHQLFLFEPETKKSSLMPTPFLEDEFATSLFSDRDVTLVGTTHERVFSFDPTDLSFAIFPGLSMPQRWNNTDSPIQNLFRTKDGIIWFGLPFDGMQKLLPKKSNFQTISIIPDMRGSWSGECVFTYNGTTWLNKVGQMKPVREEISQGPILDIAMPGIDRDTSVFSPVFYRFDEDQYGNLWVGAFHKNSQTLLRKFNKNGKLLKEFSCQGRGEECLYGAARPGRMVADKKGGLWLSRGINLCYFNGETDQFEEWQYRNREGSPIYDFWINCLYLDRQNNLWLGGESKLKKRDGNTGEWATFTFDFSIGKNVKNPISSILEDRGGTLWLATEYGVIRWNMEKDEYKIYTKKDGVPGTSVSQVFEDNQHRIWGVTDYLARYHPATDRFIPFQKTEGIKLSNWVTEVSSDQDGFIFLPTIASDMSYFHPDSLKVDTVVPPLYFTDFKLFNVTVKPGDSTQTLQQSLDYTSGITLEYGQNDFSIHYTAPEYRYAKETVFAIQLEGFQKGWQEVGTQREARYTNLNPGNYTFKVKVRNHHGFWSETPRTLSITVLPPWYRTWWAYALWAGLLLGSLYWLYRFQLKRQLAHAEAQRLKELDQAKTRLYTNITHEFRTPLTVILGMNDQVKKDPGNWLKEGTHLIRRNGKLLLNLVNQLLDLSKLESGHLPLNLIQGDIIRYLRYLTESFHSYADSKDIRLHFMANPKVLEMDYDPEKLQSVMTNLLSNAIKFTPAGGDVYLTLGFNTLGVSKTSRVLKLNVRDTGPGIPSEHLPFIFDRFYQVDGTDTRRGEGTGIGLALTRELVKLMGGQITVESEPAEGTQFTILLPITQNAKSVPEKEKPESQKVLGETILIKKERSDKTERISSSDRYSVLLVEDNPDVIAYLSSFLSSHYQIITAKNGQEGIDRAVEIIPDIIVSDVMMPEKDGFELCQALKTDERTSHIPIVLLTAKADQEDRIEGLTHGADAYLAKPFHQEELLVRLEKLIQLRQKLQARFEKAGSFRNALQNQGQTVEDRFLQKVVKIIESKMANENFGMPELCKSLHMTRTTLFRKIKALTGKSTTLFIRRLRLEKAMELLQTTDLSVTEVCYEVGFNTPSYFTRAFQEEFGMAPSEVKGR